MKNNFSEQIESPNEKDTSLEIVSCSETKLISDFDLILISKTVQPFMKIHISQRLKILSTFFSRKFHDVLIKLQHEFKCF